MDGQQAASPKEISVGEAITRIVNKNLELLQSARLSYGEFQQKINLLISSTPTGELRNEYTDINILIHKLTVSYEELLNIKSLINKR